MKNKNRFLASVLCVLVVVLCAFTLAACRGDYKCSHLWGDWTVKTSATCTDAGVQERMCSKCGDIETASIDAFGHTWKDATCTEPKTCATCKATEGSAKGHTGGTEIRNYKAPTEHEDGYTGDTYCLGCQQMISRGVVLPAISNKPTIIASDAVVEQSEETVKIMIFIENNPGIVSLKFDVLYSNMLTIQSVEFNDEFGAYVTAPSPYINPQTFNWISFGEDETNSGCFVTITFSIDSEITEDVVAYISIVLDNSNIFDSEMNLVQFDTVNATVTIKR